MACWNATNGVRSGPTRRVMTRTKTARSRVRSLPLPWPAGSVDGDGVETTRNSDRSRWFSRRDGGGDNGEAGGSAREGSPTVASGRKSYRVANATERLSAFEGLPEWFARSDADGDGQVRMSEYATSWSDDVVADFTQFDLNGDGIVTPKECLRAVEAGAVQGAASSSVASSSLESSSGRRRDRRSSSSGGGVDTTVSSSSSVPDTSSSAASTPTAGAGGVSPAYVKYAVGVIKKYDSNNDGVLQADEWSKMNKDYSSADADHDGKLTPAELGVAFSKGG